MWKGETIAIIASGPSLTPDDCEIIEETGFITIAVNHSWKLARFADVLYAGDESWWKAYGGEVDIPTERWTCTQQAAKRYKINLHRAYGEYNSGMRAIQFAVERNAARVILIGFDCSLDDGIHWHGPHDKTRNPDKSKVRKWHRQFNIVAVLAKTKNCEIINCSRKTALKTFPVQSLESVLNENSCHVDVERKQAIHA